MKEEEQNNQPDSLSFRSQAVDMQLEKLNGEVLLITPLSQKVICFLIILFVVVILTYLTNASFTKKETVRGYTRPNTGLVKVTSLHKGVVDRVYFTDGDKVKKGQVLFDINSDVTSLKGTSFGKLQIDALRSKADLIRHQANRLPTLFSDKGRDLDLRVENLEDDVFLISSQLSIYKERLQIKNKQLLDVNMLNRKGLSTKTESDRIRESILTLKKEMQELNRTLVDDENKITRLKHEINTLKINQKNEEDKFKTDLAEINFEMAKIESNRAFSVIANNDGRITNLQINEYQEVEKSQMLATIVPDNSYLEVILLVPTTGIGFVAKGQVVNIRYDAFPYEKFGIYKAEIEKISDTITFPSELKNNVIQSIEPMYEVTARLKKTNLVAYGKEFPIKVGMKLEADVELSKRSLFEWLFEPLYSIRGKVY